jgi:hypothetical protein
MPERRDHGLLEGDRTAGGPGPAMASTGYFPPRAVDETAVDRSMRALHREAK